MDRVDPMYIFNSEHSLVDLSADTRLKFSSQEVTDWLSTQRMLAFTLNYFFQHFYFLFYFYV